MAKKKETKRHSLDFGKKEKVLNYACQTYQLSRPRNVGAVMSLIRECQPQTITDWERWYFENAQTEGKQPSRITKADLDELGERLYDKITTVVIPEWLEAFNGLTRDDCIAYIHNLTINTAPSTVIYAKNRLFTTVWPSSSPTFDLKKVRPNSTIPATSITSATWASGRLAFR